MAAMDGNRAGEVARSDHESAGRQIAPLDECRVVSAAQLRELVAQSLDRLKPELLRVIDMAMGAEVYYLYMGALELIRDNPGKIEAAFHKAYLRRFDQVRRVGMLPAGNIPGASQLSLLAADDLEESLATESLANAIRDDCVEEVFGLDKRVGLLVNDPDLLRRDNPLGPDVIARAMMDALEGFDADMKSRLLVMAQLSKSLPAGVRDIYRDVNQMLVRRNVLPTIRVGLRRSGQAASAPPGQAVTERGEQAPGHGVDMVGTADLHGDLFALFQRLIGMNGGVVQPGVPAAHAGATAAEPAAAAPDSETLLQSLNQLQRGQAAAVDWSGLDAESLGNGRVNVLHGLRAGGMAQANALDTMTLDIVAMMFDYILDDSRIPDAMQALIGRLQIPVLKVAMVDKSFFSRKGHHVRKLLDALAEAGITLGTENIHQNALYLKVEALVNHLVDEFDDKVEIFAEALAELNAFLAGEQGKSEEALLSGIEAIRAMERADLSQQVAHAVVQETLIGHPIPLAIRDFIVRHWQRLLAEINQKQGSEGASWKIAVSTMANLVWSVEPKFDPIERGKLVALIPSLLKELNMGADSLGVPQDERELFFATLAPCHTLALKAVVLEDEAVPQPVMVEATASPMRESNDFEPVRPFGRAAGKRPLAAPAPTSGKPDIEGLALGSWIEFARENGELAVSRLAWISPLKGIYMFVNRSGESVMSITTRGLQAKLRRGEVRIIDDAPLMERVIDNLMERFQHRAA